MAWDGSRVSGEGGRIFSVFCLPGQSRGDRAALRLVKFGQRSHSHQEVPVAPEHREHRKYRNKAGIPQSAPTGTCRHSSWPFRHDHHRQSDDGGIGEPSWTGFVVKIPRSPASSIARRARGRRPRSDGVALCNRKWRDPLPPEGPELQDSQAGGVKRTMMTGLAAASAVMMSICSVPRPEYMWSRPWPGFRAGPKR